MENALKSLIAEGNTREAIKALMDAAKAAGNNDLLNLVVQQSGVFERVCEMTRGRSLAPSLADCRIRRARGSKAEGAVAAAIQLVMSAHGPVFEQ